MEFPNLDLEDNNQAARECKIKPTRLQVLEGKKPILSWMILKKHNNKQKKQQWKWAEATGS